MKSGEVSVHFIALAIKFVVAHGPRMKRGSIELKCPRNAAAWGAQVR
jgi:hypothetical protein